MAEAPRQLAFDLPLDPRFGREDFLVSPSNERAYGLIERWPDWPETILRLVGPRGSGKSAVGRRLAQRHGATFVDIDEQIERTAGRTVPEIFAEDGERAFRALERAAVAALGEPDRDPQLRRVIAPGGGSVVDPRNRWHLFRGRAAIWLDGRPEVLAQRLRRSPHVRPLVAGRDPIGTIRSLAASRERFYAAAHRANAIAEVGAVVEAAEAILAQATTDESTVLLRAATRIGAVVIGERIAGWLLDAEA
jgi:shikimate kinase